MARLRAAAIATVLGTTVAVLGCGVGEAPTSPSDPSDPSDPNDPNDPNDPQDPQDPDAVALSGTISQSQSISGSVELVGNAVIAPGVTITVEAGAVFTAVDAAKLRVEGTLVVAGTSASPVTMIPRSGATAWGGVVAEAGGSVNLSYTTGTAVGVLLACKAGAAQCLIEGADYTDIGQVLTASANATLDKSRIVGMANAGVYMDGGTVTITDTVLNNSSHDVVITSGGNLIVDHSEIAGANGLVDHCDFHIGALDSLSITNSNVGNAVYGFMFGNVSGAVVTGNNFENNDIQVRADPGVTDADFSGNFWTGGAAPTLPGEYDVSGALPTRIEAAGPRI